MTISFFNNALDNQAKELSREKFEELIDSPQVLNLCKRIALSETGLKKQLPAVVYQGYFPNGVRKQDEAVATGLYMVDIDHEEDPRRLYDEKARGRERELGIVAAHVTPSTKGLRLVAVCREDKHSIAENQAWLAQEMETDYDAVCHDLTRLSFLVPRDYFLYYDPSLFDLPMPEKVVKVEGGKVVDTVPATADDSTQGTTTATDGVLDIPVSGLKYRGVGYETIVREVLTQMGGVVAKDGRVAEGDRNNTLFHLAGHMRYILDFQLEKLLKVVPTLGLSRSEVASACESALKQPRNERLPRTLWFALKALGLLTPAQAQDEEAAEDDTKAPAEEQLPNFPPGIREFVKGAPEGFVDAVFFVAITLWGTLCTRLRARYLDGEMHSPSFMTAVVAPQASGKSFARKLVTRLMGRIIEQDQLSYILEQEYLRRASHTKDPDKLPKEPRTLVRFIPGNITVAKLVKRLANCKELHLLSFNEEIDTLTKNKGCKWSEISDIARCSFDNSIYGQDRAGESSVSAQVQVFYNQINLGTPAAINRYYKDVECGLPGRVSFASLPDQFGCEMPCFKPLTKKEQTIVDQQIQRCMTDTMTVVDDNEDEPTYIIKPTMELSMKFVNDALKAWNEKKRREVLMTDSRALDVFRRRAAVIAFRIAMVCYYLYGAKPTAATKRFVKEIALWAAEKVLQNQLNLFGSQMDEACRKIDLQTHYGQAGNSVKAFDELPTDFNADDVRNMLLKHGLKSKPKDMVKNWKRLNLCDTTEKRGQYKKIVKTYNYSDEAIA